MRKKKRNKETISGTPGHMVVFFSKMAAIVTAKEKIKIATESKQRNQKNIFRGKVGGSSFDTIFLPASLT